MTEEELKKSMNRNNQHVKIYASREQKLDNNIAKILRIYGNIVLEAYSPWLRAMKTKRTGNTITGVFGC